MRTKSLVKIISVLLAVSLMVSALPLNFVNFITAGESLALENDKYTGVVTDEDGNITNLDGATLTVDGLDENKASVWLSENKDATFGRSYVLEVYCDSAKEFAIYTKDFAKVAVALESEAKCTVLEKGTSAVTDEVFGTESKMYKTTFQVAGTSHENSTIKLIVTIADTSLTIAGETFIAFKYGDGEITKMVFPATGIDCAPISNIVFENEGTIKYSKPENLKIKLDVSKMDGPFEAYLYNGDVSSIATKNRDFASVLDNVNSHISSNNIVELSHFTFEEDTYTIGSDVLRTDSTNTYSVLLKDKYNQVSISVFKTERETVKVTVQLGTTDSDGKFTKLTTDANGDAIENVVQFIFLEKDGECAKLETTLPTIYGYILSSVNYGKIDGKTLTDDVYGDKTINVVYEAMKPNASIEVKPDYDKVTPNNDLGKDNGSHKLGFKLTNIANVGNTNFKNAYILFTLPTVDKEGYSLGLDNIKFATGTFANATENATADIYEIIDGEEKLIKAGVSLTASEELTISKNATAIKVIFSENALKKGASVATQPHFDADFNYDGKVEEFDIEVKAHLVAEYEDSIGELKDIETSSVATVKVENPIHKLTIKYVDLVSGEAVKTELVASYQVYDKINVSLAYPKISKYQFKTTSNLGELVDYDADADTAYMPNKDAEIVHGYYAIKPYIADTQASAQYSSVYKNDKETFYFNGLGAYLINETQEGNAPMYGYELLFTLPDNFSARTITLPEFDGKEVNAKLYYRYAGSNSWIEYTTDTLGDKVSIKSNETTTINISSMYTNGSGKLEIKVAYGDGSSVLPKTFRAQDKAQIYGVIVSDEASELKVTLKTSAPYMVENEELTIDKTCETTVGVYQPSIADVNKTSDLFVIKGDLYTYKFGNIANNGSAPLNDLKFNYTIPEATYIEDIKIGAFNGKTGDYKVVLKDKDGKIVTELDAKFENDFAFAVGEDALTQVTSIEINFGNAPTGLKCEKGIEITFYSNWSSDESERTLSGKGKLSATWTSENNASNSSEILQNFETTTKVGTFKELSSNITANKNVALKNEKVTITSNTIKNLNTVDLFDFKATYIASDNSLITEATTGAYDYVTSYTNAKFIVYAWDAEENISIAYEDTIPTENATINVPANTVKLVYAFSVLPKNTTLKTAPTVGFAMNAEAKATLSENISYRVGTVELNKNNMTVEEMVAIGNEKTSNATVDVEVGVPSVTKPVFTTDGSGYYTDTIKHSISNIKNDGNVNLYQTVFLFSASEFERFESINIGSWSKEVSGQVGYISIGSSVAGLEGGNVVVEIQKFTNVKDLASVTVPTLEDDVIVAVCVIIDKLDKNTELLSPVYCTTKLDANSVKPKDIVETEMAFGTYYGLVNDPNSITSAELAGLVEFGVANEVTPLTVVKPAVSLPITVVSDTEIDYRAPFTYTISNLRNDGNTTLSKFEIINAFSPSVRFVSMNTPVFNELATYKIFYRVNTNNDWILLQSDVNGRESIEVFAPELAAGQYITDIKLVFDAPVSEGFASTEDLVIHCFNWSDAYSIEDVTNLAEINGVNNDNVVSGRFPATYTPKIPSILQAGFEVNHPEKIYPGQKLEIKYTNIKNVSEATITQYALTQKIDENYKVLGLYTGSYEKGFSSDTLTVLYKTNLSEEGSWFQLIESVDIETNTYLEFPTLEEGEYITCISLRYGDTKEGFAEIESPVIILEPQETLENSSEYTLEASLAGKIDGVAFGELATLNFKTDFGFVNVVAKDKNDKVIATYKVYGNVGEAFAIDEVALKGYQTLSSEGDVTGTYILGESGNVTFVCKEVPKTGIEIVTSWNFIAGAVLLLAVGVWSLFPDKKKVAVK